MRYFRIRLYLLLSMAPCLTYAQWNSALTDTVPAGRYKAGISAIADYSSNSLTSAFAFSWLAGNYLNNTLKQQVSSLLGNNNRAGYEMNYGMYMVFCHDTAGKRKPLNFFVALRHKSYLNTSFTADDFQVPFYGNAGYAGKTAQLSPFNFESLSYQQAELGLVFTHFAGGAEFGAGLSFLAGQSYLAMQLPSAGLYTSPTGESITINADALLMQSDTSAQGRNGINGAGGSLDLYFMVPYKLGGKNSSISIGLSDLGFIRWNNSSLQYRKDTTYTYNGVSINSLNDIKNLSFHSLAADSLQNRYFPYKKGGFYSAIPAVLELKSVTQFSSAFHLELGLCDMFNANAGAYFYAQSDFYFGSKWMTTFQAGYGGYAGINFAASLCRQYRRSQWSLTLNRLQGFVLPYRFGGAGAYMQYSLTFGKWQ